MRTLIACLLVAAAAGAPGGAAADTPGATPLRVELGKAVEREVGHARGVLCDDPSIVRAELRTTPKDTNVLVATGLALGTTLCRVGTDPSLPSVVFEVTVVPAKRPR